jgi:RNA polymerase sigma factor (sigma-70 family)
MPDVDVEDRELLADYARNGSERAFGALTERYLSLVYSTALRVTRNPDDAEEVTQAVFVVLARKAGSLRPETILAGWLYKTARHAASNLVRGRMRRQRREQEAWMQSNLSQGEDSAWEQIAPFLDEAMGTLGDMDRTAIVLRFFQNKSNREVAAALSVSEGAAHQRVSRATEKLRKIFSRRGVSLTAAAIVAAMAANSAEAAPAGLAASVARAVAGTGAKGSAIALATEVLKAMKWAQIKWALAAVSLAALVTGLITLGPGNKSQARDAVPGRSVPAANATSAAAGAAAEATVRYHATGIETIPGFDLHIAALNNRGQVVGSLDSATNHETHSFLWEHETITDLGAFGAAKSLATSINDAGDIVGLFLTNGIRHVFLRHNSELFDLGVLDHFAKLGDEGDKYNGGPGIIYYAPRVAVNALRQVTGRLIDERGNQRSFLLNQDQTSYFGMLGDGNIFEAETINRHGQILGRATQGGGPMRSMLWQQGKLIDLGALKGASSHAAAINDRGTVVGSISFTNGTTKPFAWENGGVRWLTLGDSKSAGPSAINNAGQIVGTARARDNHSFACLWDGDALLDLNTVIKMEPGWRLATASAINDRGQILARATGGGQWRDYLLTPTVPVPTLEEPDVAAPLPAPKNLSVEPFNLSSFDRLPDGTFRLRFTGAPDGKYTIEASTNLVDWVWLGPATNNGDKLEFTDLDAPRFTLRFYRAVRAK